MCPKIGILRPPIKRAWPFGHDPDVLKVVSRAKSILRDNRKVSAKFVIILKICRE
jgi:hypothetical protein